MRDDQEGVEEGLTDHLREHFTLTAMTPPLQEPLLSELDLLGITDEAKQILEGTYECPEGFDEYTHNFIKVLQ